MTLKSIRSSLLVMLLTSMFATFSNGVVLGQLPFSNLPQNGVDEGNPGALVEQEGSMRPVNRTPLARPVSDRPEDDELGLGDESVQSVEVKERFAGWQQAGDIDGNRISDTLRSNWVMLDRNGQFTGIVRGIDGAEVAGMTIFLMNSGRLVKTAAVQEDGTFVFTNVQRGAYSFVGWGDKAFFCFGANIINESADADPSTPRSIRCYAFQNETTINTDWIRYFAPNIAYRVFGKYSTGEGPDDPDSLYGFEGLTQNPVAAEPSTSVGGAPVMLDARGRLIGRVHQMNSLSGRPVDLRSTKVMLLKGDNVLGSTTTDNFGIFQFTGVEPGGYGLVAVGVDGVGSIGIQVTDSSDNVIDAEGAIGGGGKPLDFTMVSSETVGWLNHYANDVAYRNAVLAPRPQMQTGPKYMDPVCPDGGIPGPDGRCPGASRENPICRSPCTTYGQWVANGCACGPKQPALRRIGDRVRERVEALDDRFEDAFYGTNSSSGSTYNQGGYNNGYAPTPAPYGNNSRPTPPIVQSEKNTNPPIVQARKNTNPPIVRAESAPPMPMARGVEPNKVR